MINHVRLRRSFPRPPVPCVEDEHVDPNPVLPPLSYRVEIQHSSEGGVRHHIHQEQGVVVDDGELEVPKEMGRGDTVVGGGDAGIGRESCMEHAT